MLRIRKALIEVNVPFDKIPMPPKPIIKLWHINYLVKTNIKILIRGGSPGGSTVIKATVDYISGPEFQQKAKAVGTTMALISGAVTAAVSIEAGICHLLDCTTPTYIMASSTINGYYTFKPRTRERFKEIRDLIPDENIITFCKPGSKELDDHAVCEGVLMAELWEENYRTNRTPPVLIGPHPITPALLTTPAEVKEVSFDGLLNNYK